MRMLITWSQTQTVVAFTHLHVPHIPPPFPLAARYHGQQRRRGPDERHGVEAYDPRRQPIVADGVPTGSPVVVVDVNAASVRVSVRALLQDEEGGPCGGGQEAGGLTRGLWEDVSSVWVD